MISNNFTIEFDISEKQPELEENVVQGALLPRELAVCGGGYRSELEATNWIW